ncbi:MAG: DUF4292 domain-containing protein [Bacteroidales bacterium]|nr:DUF4292 domain-containing protein [Bacteroidales bacterium]
MTILLSGCRSQQPGIKTSKSNAEAKERFEMAVAQMPDFDAVQSKVKYGMGGKGMSGKMYVELGKRLTLTMTVIGAEVARVEANEEQLIVSEKLDKIFAQFSIEEAANAIGMPDEARYEALEALMLGRIFIPGKGIAKKNDFAQLKWSQANEQGEVTGTYAGKNYVLLYTIDSNNLLRETQIQVPSKNAVVSWQYANHMQIEGAKGLLPTVAKLKGMMGEKEVQLELTLNNPQVAKKAMPVFNSSNYKEVTFEELASMIKKMKQ